MVRARLGYLIDNLFTGRGRALLLTLAGTIAISTPSWVIVAQASLTEINSLLHAVLASALVTFPTIYLFANALRKSAIAHQDLERLASHDELTGCLSRRAFIALVESCLAGDKPNSGRGAMLMVDVDHFKGINDRFGHPVGDDALRLIATAMKRCTRAKDAIGRIGGEEFAVFLPEIEPTNMQLVAERIRREVNEIRFVPAAEVVSLSVSVGGISFATATSINDLLTAADAGLYDAKKLGRNRVQLGSLR